MVVALGLGACGDAGDDSPSMEAAAPAAATVRLTESEFKIEPAQLQVTQAGVIEFQVQNKGQITHALEIEGKGVEEKTGDIAPGESATLKLDLDPASYELYCPIGNHRKQGMSANANIGLSRGTGGESEEEREREEGEREGGY